MIDLILRHADEDDKDTFLPIVRIDEGEVYRGEYQNSSFKALYCCMRAAENAVKDKLTDIEQDLDFRNIDLMQTEEGRQLVWKVFACPDHGVKVSTPSKNDWLRLQKECPAIEPPEGDDA